MDGTAKAQKVAQETMKKVKKAQKRGNENGCFIELRTEESILLF